MKTIRIDGGKYEFDYDEHGLMKAARRNDEDWPVALKNLQFCNVFNAALGELEALREAVDEAKAQTTDAISAHNEARGVWHDSLLESQAKLARVTADRDVLAGAIDVETRRFDGMNHWEECGARPEDDEGEGDIDKCCCTKGALVRLARVLKAPP